MTEKESARDKETERVTSEGTTPKEAVYLPPPFPPFALDHVYQWVAARQWGSRVPGDADEGPVLGGHQSTRGLR